MERDRDHMSQQQGGDAAKTDNGSGGDDDESGEETEVAFSSGGGIVESTTTKSSHVIELLNVSVVYFCTVLRLSENVFFCFVSFPLPACLIIYKTRDVIRP